MIDSGPVSTTYRTGGGWRGTPRNVANAGATANRARQDSMEAALGIGTQEATARQAETGVNVGTTGYQSGQVAPSGQAMGTLAAFSAPPADPTQAPAGTRRTGPSPTAAPAPRPTAAPQPTGPTPTDQLFGGGDTVTTTSSALTAGAQPGAPPVQTGSRIGGPATAGSTTTRTGAITTGPTGTTRGDTPVPTGEQASPTVRVLNEISPGLGDSLDPGSKLIDKYGRPYQADLTPALATQAAGFGLSDDLSRERFDYRPGAAASQGVVQTDRTQTDETRARQMAALDALTAAANGTVPSAAELQLRQEAGRNVAATLGQARALGGRSAGGAARAGTLASADILARTNAEGAQLRAAEQDRNRQAQMQAALGIRGQDADAATRDAQLRQEAYSNNLRAQLEQNELAERHRQNLLAAQLQALGIGGQAAGAAVQGSGANADRQNKFNSGIYGMLGQAVGMGG
jgi:hypothetical protein